MRDALLFVSGTTPQIISETIWALNEKLAPFDELELHIITTTHGHRITERRLVADGILHQLCTELGIAPLPRIEFHLIRNQSGELLDDIRDGGDNTHLANSIMDVVRKLTSDSGRRIHASLSGGRKTMSFYLGYAMSLYGRPEDMLYHVMVPADFERCPEFFYIPSVPKIVTSVDGRKLSTADAWIELADIPFLRLRDWIDEPILNAEVIDFGVVTRKVQGALDRLTLTFDSDDCAVVIGDSRIGLAPQSFAMYRLLAETCAEAVPGAGPDGVGENHKGWLTAFDFSGSGSRGTLRFLDILNQLPKASAPKYEYVKAVIDREGTGTRSRERMGRIFNPILARLGKELSGKIVDPAIRKQFGIHRSGRNPTRYGLLLQRGQISGL